MDRRRSEKNQGATIRKRYKVGETAKKGDVVKWLKVLEVITWQEKERLKEMEAGEDAEPTEAEGAAVPPEAGEEEETGGDCLSKTKKKQEQVPLMCAFDKTRECNASCVAFYVVHSANVATWGCKRMP